MTHFFDIDRWSEIFQTIGRNRKRSVMTALGVFWGIFMLTVMLGAGSGLELMFRNQLGGMATNTVLMQPQQTGQAYHGMPKNRWWQLSADDVERLRQLPEVLYVSGVKWAGAKKCHHEQRTGEYTVMGYSADYQRIQPQKIASGRYINEMDMVHNRKVCVIGQQVQRDLFPGDEAPIGKTIIIGNTYFTVVGVIHKQNSVMSFSDLEQTIIVPLTLAQTLYNQNGRNTLDMIAVAGRADTPSDEVVKACRTTLFTHHLVAPDDEKALWTIATKEMFEKVQGLFSGIALLTWIVGLGTLLAGIVGVSNIMLVLVKERTQEIGIRRALGAPPTAIISQILSESFVLTLLAGLLGLTAAVALLSGADSLTSGGEMNTSWQISFGTAMAALGLLVGGSLIAGIIPAFRALKIKAVDAIREE